MQPRPSAAQSLRVICLGVTLLSPSAFAQVGGSNAECRNNPHLARAREQYEELQFEEAAATLQRAIEYSSNCKPDLAEVYRLKAFVDAVIGERERCHRDFEIFLALNPSWTIPANVPPKIKSCYEDAILVAPQRRELRLEHEAPKDVLPNTPVSLKVKVVDPLRLVDQVKVYFRREGVKIFTVVSARADDNVSIVIPALSLPPDPEGYKMEYVVRAVDRWDGVLSEDGTPREPKTFLVSAAAGAITEEWWFWAAVGAGAIGLGLSLFFAAQSSDQAVTLTVHDKGIGGS
ncbi:MAG: hypothetical protein HYV07_04520 [Deltaproteobacteria bacterium]|nr:hypothetical protein [Deltaproteobacteria bacterium]